MADPGFSVRTIDSRIYVVELGGNISRALVEDVLATIWARPDWAQPWGLVVVLAQDVTYDIDVRGIDVPPPNRRAVGTAIVTSNTLHRMLVSTIAVGLKLTQRFRLSAHENESNAVEHIAAEVLSAESDGRAY